MGILHQFEQSVVQVLKHNKDGSRETQADRGKSLKQSVNTIHELGYQLTHVRYIKEKHIRRLVNHWLTVDELGAGTIKNRMSHIRWLMQKVNKASAIPSNDNLNIPKRIYVTNEDKSRELTDDDLNKIHDDYMEMSLKAQKLFGLRMEESLKVQPFVADQGDQFFVKKSWAKGGRERTISIVTAEQRQWLDDCKLLVKFKKNSLIPTNTSFITYYRRFRQRCDRNGINKRHGHRHLYAQQRYQALTGMPCRAKGGLFWKEMTKEQLELDKAARLQISKDIGHSRASISNAYLGSVRK